MSFIRDYLTYASGNECPIMFHVWSGYTTLSAAISRKVWLPLEDTAIYPNLYVMLVGKAGNGKSWALSKAKRMLAELGDIPLSRSIETPEGLWRFMNGNPKADPPVPSPVEFVTRWPDGALRSCHPMTIIANEFVNYISQNPTAWVSALNDIYDEDKYEYRTKNQGEDNLIGPYLVLLGALTTEVSSDLQKARIISTGLARRTIFQHGERTWDDPHALPRLSPEQVAAKLRCIEHLKVLRKVAGEFHWGEGAEQWWTDWYNPHLLTVPKHPPQTQSWYASKSTQVLKLAMLTSLSENSDFSKLIVEVGHFQASLSLLETMEKDLFKIFGGVGRNELAAVAAKIHEFVSNLEEPIVRAKLKSKFFMDCKPPTDFDDCLTYLLGEGHLQSFMCQLGEAVSDLIATPETMSRWREKNFAKVVLPPDATPSG